MSSQTLPLPAPPRRRRYGWWIAGGIVIPLLALLVFAGIYFAQPVKFILGFFQGNPTLPGCRTTVVAEANAGPLWNRLVDISCPGKTLHFVFVRREPSPLPFVLPALMSADGPAPVAVRQTGDAEYEIELATPLDDGRTSVPIKLDQNGLVKEFLSFDHGRPMKLKSPIGL